MAKRSKKGRRGRSLSSLNRKPGKQKPRKVMLIVCEGKTEKVYFDALVAHYRLARIAEIKITDEGSSAPINVVDAAINLIQKRQREAKRSNFLLPYDEAWGVIDVENPIHNLSFNAAVNKADNEPEKIKLAVSNPAFEYWFVLHFEHTSRPFGDGQEVKRYLRNHLADYEEGQDVFPDLFPYLETALDGAERILTNCSDQDRYPNPSTFVFCLVKRLQKMATHSEIKQTEICEGIF